MRLVKCYTWPESVLKLTRSYPLQHICNAEQTATYFADNTPSEAIVQMCAFHHDSCMAPTKWIPVILANSGVHWRMLVA